MPFNWLFDLIDLNNFNIISFFYLITFQKRAINLISKTLNTLADTLLSIDDMEFIGKRKEIQ
jgi:hypothetical protein